MKEANAKKGPRKALPARENRNLCSIIRFGCYTGRPRESSGNLLRLRVRQWGKEAVGGGGPPEASPVGEGSPAL
jgi:hypothetical protein